MKQWIFSASLVLLSITCLAGKRESLPVNYYYVASDVVNDSIPKGKCLVKGVVTEGYSELPVHNGLISNFDRSSHTLTNENGEFNLLISAKDTGLFFFKKNFKEIVCWKYAFKSQHVVTMNFITSEKLPDGMMIIEEKPVIYLYSDGAQKVNLRLDEKINLTTSYPPYEGGWEVLVNESKMLLSKDKEYPYLFWEGESEDLSFQLKHDGMEGYVINTDSSIVFLERTLTEAGLNFKESTDFITYWAPRLQEHPYAFIQFLLDDIVDNKIGQLYLTPTPDHQRRIYMLFQGFSELPVVTNLEKPQWEPLERSGLLLIEWGGSELTSQQGF